MVTQVIMLRRNRDGEIEGQPIIELQTEREVEDTHIAISGERFELRKKIEIPVMCKKCLQFNHPKILQQRRKILREMFKTIKRRGGGKQSHMQWRILLLLQQRTQNDRQKKCDEYRKEKEILNKMTE